MPPGRTSTLPAELLSLIFAPLCQPDVLAVAAVCAWWRVNAIRAPMYYRAWTFIFPRRAKPSIWRRDDYDDLGTFLRVVAGSEAGNYSLGLRVFVELELLPDSPAIVDVGPSVLLEYFGQGQRSEADLDVVKAELDGVVMPVLRRAVARCVVLNLVPDTESTPMLVNGLSGHAPLLRSLNINMSSVDPHTTPRLPADFLAAATAPPRRLTEVTLRSADVLSPAPPCLPAVRSLHLLCPNDALRLHDVAAVFPNLRRLTVEAQFFLQKLQSCGSQNLLGGLQELHFGPRDSSFTGIVDFILDDAKQVPYIQYRGAAVERFAPLLSVEPTGRNVPISLHLFEHVRRDGIHGSGNLVDGDLMSLFTFFRYYSDVDKTRFSQLCVELHAGHFIRVVDSDVPFAHVFGLLSTAGCARYVTELTIDDRHLVTFMKTCGAFMPRLTSLRVDLLTWAATLGDESSEETLELPQQWWQTATEESGILSEGGPPRGDFGIEWPALESIELRATRPHSTISQSVLSSLAHTFNGPGLRLTLSNGLSLAPDAQGADVAALFSDIRCSDDRFYPELDGVVRVEQLLRHATKAASPGLVLGIPDAFYLEQHETTPSPP